MKLSNTSSSIRENFLSGHNFIFLKDVSDYYNKFFFINTYDLKKLYWELSDQQKVSLCLEVNLKEPKFSHLIEMYGISCLEEDFLESEFFVLFAKIVNAIRYDFITK